MNFIVIQVLIILSAVIIITAVFAMLARRKERKLNEEQERKFGKIPEREFGLRFDSISSYWFEKLMYDKKENCIDEITWNDLDMDKVYSRINNCCTSVGEEYLFSKMHEPESTEENLITREELIYMIDEDIELRNSLRTILSKMGKTDYNGLSSFCYDVSTKRIKNHIGLKLLAVLPIVFIILFFVNPAVGFSGLFISLCTNGIIHYFTSIRVSVEMTAIKYLSVMLWGANQINELFTGSDLQVIKDIEIAHNAFKRIGGKLSSLGQKRMSDLDSIMEYVQLIFLSEIRRYNKVINTIEKHPEEFRKLFTGIGEVDLALNILSFRKSLPAFSRPKFIDENAIVSNDIYHPLIVDPVCNTVSLPRYSLVSGSNASGKSTFIKSIAINAILAQTIYTCTAKSFSMKFSNVMTSMAIRDDITSGDSYFISEIKSMKRIVDMIPKMNCLCVFDEILRGTNTIERIAASTSVLEHIASLDCLCIVASHDIELTNNLDGLFHNYHFSEKITENGVVFDYTIREGATQTRNAITLLDFLNFDSSITDNANELVSQFEKTKKWKDS